MRDTQAVVAVFVSVDGHFGVGSLHVCKWQAHGRRTSASFSCFHWDSRDSATMTQSKSNLKFQWHLYRFPSSNASCS